MLHFANKYAYLIIFLIYGLAAFFSTGFHHHDEHYQLLEFAGLKFGINGLEDLSWEYGFQVRPTFQVGVALVLGNLLKALGSFNPFLLVTLLRFLSAVLSLTAIHLMLKVFTAKLDDPSLRKWLFWLAYLLWFGVYVNVRFSSEGWSGSFFMIGMATTLLGKDHSLRNLLLGGLVLGIAFLCRYQVGFMILGFYLWLWLIRKVPFPHVVYSAFMVILIAGLGMLLDRWFYGEWTFSAWRYVEQNIFQEKIRVYGGAPQPFWQYFIFVFTQGIPPFSLVYLSGFLLFLYFYPKEALSWVAVPFVVAHMILGHKELRFLFPLAGFIPFMVIFSLEALQKRVPGLLRASLSKFLVKAFWIVNLLLLGIVAFRAPKQEVVLLQELYPPSGTLYYLDTAVETELLPLRFYHQPGLSFVRIQALSEIPGSPASARLFVATEPDALQNWPGEKKLVYQSYPNWLQRFNFNDWQSRTKRWFVWELLPED